MDKLMPVILLSLLIFSYSGIRYVSNHHNKPPLASTWMISAMEKVKKDCFSSLKLSGTSPNNQVDIIFVQNFLIESLTQALEKL